MNLALLHEAVAAVCPIDGVSVGRADDRATWRAAIRDEATDQQRAAAAEVLATWAEPAERRMVPKGVIVERLIAAGKIEAARAALATLSVADQERWNAKPAVYADDARALALLRAIGADPAVILAP